MKFKMGYFAFVTSFTKWMLNDSSAMRLALQAKEKRKLFMCGGIGLDISVYSYFVLFVGLFQEFLWN